MSADTIQTLNSIADFVLLSSAPAILLFVIFYSRSPWRSTPAGRALMLQGLGLFAIVVTVLLSLFLGKDYPGRPFVRLSIYGFTSFAFWRLFHTLRKYQKEGEVPLDFNPFRKRPEIPRDLDDIDRADATVPDEQDHSQ